MSDSIQELVVISGKGGTGKTSLTAAFAALADNAVLADCDVDAADLHLVLNPDIRTRHVFKSGHEAAIRQADCVSCGACLAHCRFGAVLTDGRAAGEAEFTIDPVACEGCNVCVRLCPVQAIDFPEATCGEWYVSDTRFGPMVHARLGAAAENSGKLVSVVRREAQRIAQEGGGDLILVDGPPGVGCPVIASITGATRVLIVTEPTLSGKHDLARVLSLTRHFDIPAFVCVNRWDINPEMTERIRREADEKGAELVGLVPYDPKLTKAQIQGVTMMEYDRLSESGKAIEATWQQIAESMGLASRPAVGVSRLESETRST